MTIKEVERLTGLTAKSIRYYESKHLITVARNKENSYRDYSETDVEQLKRIKLLRYLDFSVEEIEKLLDMNTIEMKKALRQKADTFSSQKNLCEDKQEICLALAEDYGNSPRVVEEYNDTIEFLESGEMYELAEALKDMNAPDLSSTIIETLIFMAPVFGLFFNIKVERIGMLMINGIAAVIGSSLTTWIWIRYLNEYRKYRARIKKKNREMIGTIPGIIFAVTLSFIAIVGITVLIQTYMVPKDFLFFEPNPVAGMGLVWLVVILVSIFSAMAIEKILKPSEQSVLNMWKCFGIWRLIVIVVWLMAAYCCVTSFNVVTSDKIICHSPLKPKGIAYSYSDVKSIKTGFGNRNFSLLNYKKKGSFYYQIEVGEKIVTFQGGSVNEEIKRYEEHTYLELEEFDQALVALKIPKESDKSGWENCDFDKEYVDRFIRIVELR